MSLTGLSTAWDAARALVDVACAIDELMERVATLVAAIETEMGTLGADDVECAGCHAGPHRRARSADQIDREIENIWQRETERCLPQSAGWFAVHPAYLVVSLFWLV